MQSSRGVTVFDPGGAAVATPSDRTLATTKATAVSSPRRTGPRRLRAAPAVGLPAPDPAMISLASFGRQTSRPVPGNGASARELEPWTGELPEGVTGPQPASVAVARTAASASSAAAGKESVVAHGRGWSDA